MGSYKQTTLLFLSSILLCSCSNQSNNSADSASVGTPTKIAFTVYRGDDAFIQKMAKFIHKGAESIGSIDLQMQDSQNSQEIQNRQIDQMINSGVKGLLINMVDTSAESGNAIVSKARAASIPVIFYNRSPGKQVLDSYDKSYYVGSIPAQSGIIQGEMIVKQWKEHPQWDLNGDGVLQYVILKGSNGNADAEGRTKWVSATIQNYPNANVEAELLEVYSANWMASEAQAKVTQWLDGEMADKIEMIIANNDDMAIGAVKALGAKGKFLPVFGVDATPDALALVRSGKIAGTVLQDSPQQAREAVNLAANVARGNNPSLNSSYSIVDKNLMIPYVAVDGSNLDKYFNYMD